MANPSDPFGVNFNDPASVDEAYQRQAYVQNPIGVAPPGVVDAARQDPTVSQNYWNQQHAGERDPFAAQQTNPNDVWRGGTQAGQPYRGPATGVYPPPNTYQSRYGQMLGTPYVPREGIGAPVANDVVGGIQDALGGLFGGLRDVLNFGAGSGYNPSARTRLGVMTAPPEPYSPLPTNQNPPSTYYNPLESAPQVPTTPYNPLPSGPAQEGAPVQPPVGVGAPPPIPPGAPFGYDPNTRTYGFYDGKGGSSPMTEKDVQAMLSTAATANGLSMQELWDFMVNKANAVGSPIFFKNFSADTLSKIAADAASNKQKDPDSVKPGGTPSSSGVRTGAKTEEQIREQATSNRTEAGAAANRYFQDIVLSQPQAADSYATYAAAVNGGFTGNYTSWLVTKDQILHQARGFRGGSSGGGGGGGGGAPGVTPVTLPNPTVTEPNVRPFGPGPTVQFDQSDLQAIPDSYRTMVDSLMRKLGYVSTGFMGQFGETEYQTPQNPVPLTDATLAQVSSDPAAQAWLKWLLYRKGVFSGVSPWPVTPPAAGA